MTKLSVLKPVTSSRSPGAAPITRHWRSLNRSIAQLLGSVSAIGLDERVGIEGYLDSHTLLLADGTIASSLRLHGSMTPMSLAALDESSLALATTLSGAMRDGAHSIHIHLSRDARRGGLRLHEPRRRLRAAAQRARLDLDQLFATPPPGLEQVSEESVLFSILTRQSPIMVERRDLMTDHQALTRAISTTLRNHGQLLKLLTVDEITDQLLHALCALSPLPARLAAGGKPQLIADQLPDGHMQTYRQAFIGDTLYEGFDLVALPDRLLPINTLMAAIRDLMPVETWRLSILIEPCALRLVGVRDQAAAMLQFASPGHNRRIRDAIAALGDIDSNGAVRMRASLAVWSEPGGEGRLGRLASAIRRAVARWGGARLGTLSGDPLATILSSAPLMARQTTAPPTLMTLSGLLSMAPLARTGSPWRDGDITFVTADGQPWFYQPGSSHQANWLTLIAGSPGSGKSVAMNAMSLSMAIHCGTQGGRALLPRMGVLDIGGSSLGLATVLKDSLPNGRKHEVAHHALAITNDRPVNIFDTLAGSRIPMPGDRAFMVNFVSLLCSVVGSRQACPPRGLIGAAIDEAYLNSTDSHNPVIYSFGEEAFVDQSMREAGLGHDGERSWWEIADLLYAAGLVEGGVIAQSRAVPTLVQLALATGSERLRTIYEDAVIPATGESAMRVLRRCASEAMRDFPILGGATRMALPHARVNILELVPTPLSDPAVDALLYMLGRHLLTRGWFTSESDIDAAQRTGAMIPECVQQHRTDIAAERGAPKLLCIDEYHRVAGIPELASQILVDAREGRKANIRITLASQFLGDFGEQIQEVASSIFVFGTPPPESIEAMARSLGLDESEQAEIASASPKIGPHGAPLLAVMRHDQGVSIQRLTMPLGGAELWAHTTNARDVAVRKDVFAELGPSEGCAALASRFPGGTIRDLPRRADGTATSARALARSVLARWHA